MDAQIEHENGNLIVRTRETYVFFGGSEDYIHLAFKGLDLTVVEVGGAPRLIVGGKTGELIKSGNGWVILGDANEKTP